MKIGKLDTLVRASEARYLIEYEKIRSLVEREAAIGQRLAELAAHSRRASQTDAGYAQSGAHARWESWAGQMATVLNTELAQIRAQRQRLDTEMRRAFARHTALKSLNKSDMARRKQDRDAVKRTQLEQLVVICSLQDRWASG
ncbi:hypothetical protein M3P21_14840 [Ruegeria sp. 2012CJ41-6]|uniref:Flagellar FliJ protein n=1 Tax=Ruegeria spongiae TaxID=2942209 RepID=A0ABT0Q4N9_9RHOB|nr:hypothetical protein [Ruegeria spongiae]MCL6284808.1 hypothetical protein [Ruegeria spongiae]